MSYLTPEEKAALASSMINVKTKWYNTRKKVLKKLATVKKDEVMREILYVLIKIYYELKKPK